MARFVAIPVGQGDAFFLEREKGSILVDGGRSQLEFAALFQSSTGRNAVDIAVCTHNDADHANGILGAIEAGLVSREVWLPGRWGAALQGVLQPMPRVARSIAMGVKEAFPHGLHEEYLEEEAPHEKTLLERVAEHHYREWSDRSVGLERHELVDGWPQGVQERLEALGGLRRRERFYEEDLLWEDCEQIILWVIHEYPRPRHWIAYCRGIRRLKLDVNQFHLFLEAMEAAARIRRIAIAAFHRGLKVRWFEHDPGRPRGGVPDLLLPLSSRELVQVRSVDQQGLFRMLALTVANRESLVFWSPGNEAHPGVLFTADSDLKSVKLPQQLDGSIVTAPHHGSKSNENAYKVVQSSALAPDTVTWVRSDGRYRSRPGEAYLNLTGRRACTICHRGRHFTTKQAVRFYSRSGTWVRHRQTRICTCQ